MHHGVCASVCGRACASVNSILQTIYERGSGVRLRGLFVRVLAVSACACACVCTHVCVRESISGSTSSGFYQQVFSPTSLAHSPSSLICAPAPFRPQHSHGDGGHDENMYAVFLHVAGDVLGSIGVITSGIVCVCVGVWVCVREVCVCGKREHVCGLPLRCRRCPGVNRRRH